MSRLLALLALGTFGASTAEAQTLVLCDADWMDVERVLALITVEVDEPPSYVFRVTSCTEESAHVAVSGPNGLAREREVRLASAAPEARSRLVALVLVELVRLGTRERPAEAAPPAASETREPTSASVSASETREPTSASASETREPTSASDSGTGSEVVSELGASVESAGGVEAPPSAGASSAAEGSCTGRLPARMSARGCTGAFGLGVGLSRHQLGRQTHETLWGMQLRLRARWRSLLVGARVSGVVRAWSLNGTRVNVASYTTLVGAELFSARAGRVLFVISAVGELGIIRFRERQLGCPPDVCFDDAAVGVRATYGALLAARVEIPIRSGGLAFELEGGWTRGLLVASFDQPITGVGGVQLGLLVEATFGRSS